MTRVIVLGGGPAGVGATYALSRRGLTTTLVEQRDTVGGNSASFELEGLRVDYGSHRLHPIIAEAGLIFTIAEDMLDAAKRVVALAGAR